MAKAAASAHFQTQKQQQEPPAAKVAAYIFYAEITFPAVRTWKWVTGTA